MCEPVILATIGSPQHKPFPGLFGGVRREHSRKPESFYAHVDRCCPGLGYRADVFSRESRPGWATWGREATKFDTTDSAVTRLNKRQPRQSGDEPAPSSQGRRSRRSGGAPDVHADRLPHLFDHGDAA